MSVGELNSASLALPSWYPPDPRSHFASNPDLVVVLHVATNPDPVVLGFEVKSTCKYPVDDVYTSLELTKPDRRAICSVAEPLHDSSVQPLHDDSVQRLMVTLS